MTKYVGIDQSFSKCAVWVWDSESDQHQFNVFSQARPDNTVFTTVDAAESLAWSITRWLKDSVGFDNIWLGSGDLISCEQLAFGGQGNVAKDLAMLLAIFISIFKNGDLATQPYLAPIGQVKKLATGRGTKVSKTEMFEALPEDIQELILASEFKTKSAGREDLADAYHICQWLIREVDA